MVRDMQDNQSFHGPNAGYVLELYDRYLNDPSSLDSEWQGFFATWTPPAEWIGGSTAVVAAEAVTGVDIERVLGARSLADAIRRHGHLAAKLMPIGEHTPDASILEASAHGVSESDLAALPPSVVGGKAAEGAATALEAIEKLRDVYCGTLGYEYTHIPSEEQRNWLRDAAESGRYHQPLTTEQQVQLLDRLTAVEGFERFLHQTYLGQKRFSIEGNDILVPMLDEVIRSAFAHETSNVVIGMAHRGRLNVLTHVLGKPYADILAEFDHLAHAGAASSDPDSQFFSGDVKYHLGWNQPGGSDTHPLPVVLAPNPSHLEYVNPVVEGMARALQDTRTIPGMPAQEQKASLPIVLHGDAAFPGQGVVAETLNLARLAGFNTGGTIHIIVNNLVGYTTDWPDSRSTLYSSDLAKGFEIPIIHVNADDPEACLAAARLAMAYRDTFHQDFVIDLIGYRRWGHNEGDDPTYTQPQMYAEIAAHDTVRAIWAKHLEKTGVIPEGDGERRLNALLDQLHSIRENQTAHEVSVSNGREIRPLDRARPEPVDEGEIRMIHESMHTFPEDFTLNPKLKRQLERRKAAIDKENSIDWAHAEALAFGTLLTEAVPVRLTGQDSERGTFGQRHLVLHDPESGRKINILHNIPGAEASFAVYNSPLSETGVMGFEYGYSVVAKEALVLWEAQFGDFANSAQVIIDQFLTPSASKWRQKSGLVLLLPHGYEGQGPEHSSARLERFLQMAANNNIRVANCTTSAQYFHLLRRQAASLADDPRPLIVMTPKSLLRHPRAASSLSDLVEGTFREVIDDARAAENPKRVKRVVLCSGKVYVDLVGSKSYAENDAVAVVRVEELYPFPAGQLQSIIGAYSNATEVIWLQEEPENMGAWRYIRPHLEDILGPELSLRYIGRSEQASPAEGSIDDHQVEQQRIVEAAFSEVLTLEMSATDD